MSLVHPILPPQVAVRATRGKFFGPTQEYVALLYTDRVEFRPLDIPDKYDDDSAILKPVQLEITIPQPPMTMGDSEDDILPNLGGLFFTVGRNRDMLVMQFDSLLLILSVNYVDQIFQLQGVWGLPKKNREVSSKNSLAKAASAASFSSLMESHYQNGGPQLGHRQSGMCLQSSLPLPMPSPDGSQIFVASRHKSGVLALIILDCFGKEVIKHDVDYLDILTLGWLSNDCVYFVYLNSKFHKKFQTCRLGPKTKQSGFLGFGGKKMVTNTFIPECHVTIASDFVPSNPDINGCEDLIFKDYVLLGTRGGDYIRVYYKGSGSWEHVQNAKNILGALKIDDTALLIQRAVRNSRNSKNLVAGHKMSLTPTASNQLQYCFVSDGTVHAIRGDPEVGACLCSKHNIDGDRRYRIKLLSLGNGLILDYKRFPLRLYRLRSSSTAHLEVVPHSSNHNITDIVSLVTSNDTADFLIKTEDALYTRDPNGCDGYLTKIVIGSHPSVIRLSLGRPGLAKAARRDVKSIWGVFNHSAVGTVTPNGTHVIPASDATTYPPEIRILEESHKNITKVRVKAQFQFTKNNEHLNLKGPGGSVENKEIHRWYINRLCPIHKNVLIVGLSSVRVSANHYWEDDIAAYKRHGVEETQSEWAIFLVTFVGSTSKSHPVPPKGHLLMHGSSPEIAPQPMPFPTSPNQYTLQVYNYATSEYTSIKRLSVNPYGEFKLSTISVSDSFLPHSLTQSPSLSYFTDNVHESFEGTYYIGQKKSTHSSTPTTPGSGAMSHCSELTGILSVDSPNAANGFSVLIEGKTIHQTKLWVFDSNNLQFREFSYSDVPENRKQMLYRQEQLLSNEMKRCSDPAFSKFHVNPLFRAQYFVQTASVKQIWPLPELKAVICEGIGIGVDAEAFLKTPDFGYYAIFRIQNKKLLDSLNRLRKTILSERVGNWLPEEVKEAWLEKLDQSHVIAGTIFAAYWRLDTEQQHELCEMAGVPTDLMDKVRPS